MELKPGRELDALIAEKVFGDKPIRTDCEVYNRHGGWLRPYSSSIEAAWEVVEKMTARPGFELDCQITPAKGPGGLGWYCNFGDSRHGEYGETAPHAICLAALKAVRA